MSANEFEDQYTEEVTEPCVGRQRREHRRFPRLHADAQLHFYALPRDLGGIKRQCAPATGAGAHQAGQPKRNKSASPSPSAPPHGSIRTGRWSR